MKKSDWTIPAVIFETLTILCGLIYVGLQIFYGIYYGIAVWKIICNILVMVFVYAALMICSIYPEKINQLSPGLCKGKVRIYTLRMLRLIRLIFAVSLLIPCIADAVGVEIRSAYSAVTILLIVGIAIFYEYRIFKELQER